MPVFRDTNTDGFPDYIAKGTVPIVMVDLFNEKLISEHEVKGACWGGLPVDSKTAHLFLWETTPLTSGIQTPGFIGAAT